MRRLFPKTALRPLLLLASLSALLGCSPAPREGSVVVTVGPLYGLTAALLEGVATPEPLQQWGDIHQTALRPSQARRLGEASLTVWLGPEFEPGLAKVISREPQRSFALVDVAGLQFLEVPDHPGEKDPHIWLSVGRMRLVAAALAERLAVDDPAHAERIAQNAAALDRRLAALSEELERRMSALREEGYIVHHEAYQYFERDYGLAPLAVLQVSEHLPISARHMADIEAVIDNSYPVCLLVENDPPGKLSTTIAGEKGLKIVVADPLGRKLAKGPDLYERSLRAIASAFEDCLNP